MNNATQHYLDTREAAGFLGMSPATLEAWRTRGGGPKYHKFGKAVRYSRPDLEEFASASVRSSTSTQAA
jgi:hypothetical protein